MSRFRYSQEMIEFIAATYAEVGIADTTRLFNYAFGTKQTDKAIKSCIKNHGITCGRTTGQIRKGVTTVVTREQRDWIEANYKIYSLPELVEALNSQFGTAITKNQLRSFVRNHGITCGRTGQFEKGQQSWNSGMKGFQAGGRSSETQFKKGDTPVNHRPVGSERVNVDGYIELKVAEPNRWRLKHREVWEQSNGKLPPGRMLWFKDNNPLNCDIDNLMVVTRAQHAVVNRMGLQHAQGDYKHTAVLLADIKMATTKRKKGERHV